MFDIENFKKKAAAALGEASRKIRQYTPEAFSPEKKFVNAMVSSIALIIVADRKVETEEVVQGMEFIKNLDPIRELNLELEAIEMFDYIIQNTMQYIDNEPRWIIETSKVLANIGLISDNPSYVNMISEVLDHIAGSDGNVDQTEIVMKTKIMDVLKKRH
jgi:tellurite resistance protein